MATSETGSLSVAPARTANETLTNSDIDRMMRRLRGGMEKLASNACDMTMPDRIVLRRELREFCPGDDSTIYRWERDPKIQFPRSFEVSGRLKGWSLAEILGWYIKLLEKRDRQAAGDA